MSAVRPVGTLVCGLGEGPAWDERSASLLSVDLHRGTVLRNGTDVVLQREDGAVCAVIPHEDGDSILVRSDRIESQAGDVLIDIPIGDAERCNDATTDPWGRIWVGTMHRTVAGLGALFLLDDEGPTRCADGFGICNGIGFSPDRTDMYVVDSTAATIEVFSLDPETGRFAGHRATWRVDGVPDGLAVDSRGGIWVADFGGGSVRGYDNGGEPFTRIDVPTPFVTSVAFGGPHLATLYVTTATRPGTAVCAPAGAGLLHATSIDGVVGEPIRPCVLAKT